MAQTVSVQTVYKYVDQKGSAAMLTVKRAADMAPEVNLRNLLYMGEGSTLAFELKEDIIRSSKQGYQWPKKMD